eukprot:UN00201
MVTTVRFWKNLCCCFICFIILSALLSLAPLIQYSQDDTHHGVVQKFPDDAAYFVHKTAMITGSCDGTIIPTASSLIQNSITVILGCNDTETVTKTIHKLNNTNTNQTNLLVRWRFNGSDLSNLTCIDAFVANFKFKYPALHILINNGINLNFSGDDSSTLAHFYLMQKLSPLLSNTSGLSRIINVPSKHVNDAHIIVTNEYNKRHNNKSVYAVSLRRQSQIATMLTDVALMSDDQYLQFGRKHLLPRNKHNYNIYENSLAQKVWSLSAA